MLRILIGNLYIRSSFTCCRNNDFEGHIISRAKMILTAIENATGKTISGKDSDEVIKSFGRSLA